MATIEMDLPGAIDGTPAEVEAQVLAQLVPTIDEFAGLIDDAVKQLANAERQRIIEQDPGIPAEHLGERYEMSERAGQLSRLTGAAKALCAVAAEVDRG